MEEEKTIEVEEVPEIAEEEEIVEEIKPKKRAPKKQEAPPPPLPLERQPTVKKRGRPQGSQNKDVYSELSSRITKLEQNRIEKIPEEPPQRQYVPEPYDQTANLLAHIREVSETNRMKKQALYQSFLPK